MKRRPTQTGALVSKLLELLYLLTGEGRALIKMSMLLYNCIYIYIYICNVQNISLCIHIHIGSLSEDVCIYIKI